MGSLRRGRGGSEAPNRPALRLNLGGSTGSSSPLTGDTCTTRGMPRRRRHSDPFKHASVTHSAHTCLQPFQKAKRSTARRVDPIKCQVALAALLACLHNITACERTYGLSQLRDPLTCSHLPAYVFVQTTRMPIVSESGPSTPLVRAGGPQQK